MKKSLIVLFTLTLVSLVGCAADGMSGSTSSSTSADSKAMAGSAEQMRADCGPGLAPNAPVGQGGRLPQGAMMSDASMDRAACAKIGVTLTPNLPVGQPGRLSAMDN